VLAEEEAERTPLEQPVRLASLVLRLQLGGQVEHGLELGGRPVADARQGAAVQLDAESCGQRDVKLH
jgi:hypothetical protein